MRPGRGLCEAGKTVRKTEPRRFLDWQRRWPNNGEVSVVDDIKLALLGNKEAALKDDVVGDAEIPGLMKRLGIYLEAKEDQP